MPSRPTTATRETICRDHATCVRNERFIARFTAANKAAGMLMRSGHVVFSPISHTHPIAEECEMPKGWEFWERFDRAYLSASACLVALCIDGWRESKGVQAEIGIAREMAIAIIYISEQGIVLTPKEVPA